MAVALAGRDLDYIFLPRCGSHVAPPSLFSVCLRECGQDSSLAVGQSDPANWLRLYCHDHGAACHHCHGPPPLVGVAGIFLRYAFVGGSCIVCFPRGLRAEAQPEFLALVALRVSAWCNLALMVIALALVQFFWLDLPDTRAFAVSEYVTYAWQQYDLEHAAVPVFAILLAVAGTLQDVQWYLLQQASGVALPVTMKIAAWLVVLMIQATKLGVLQLVILGIVSIVTASSGANRQVLRKRLWRRSVLLPIALVFVSYLALTKMPQLWNAVSEKGANEVSSATSDGAPRDPCDRIWANTGAGAGTDSGTDEQGITRRQAELASLESSLSVALQTDHAQAQARLQRDIEMQVATAYAQAEAGVDAFLDWNFSLAGPVCPIWSIWLERV